MKYPKTLVYLLYYVPFTSSRYYILFTDTGPSWGYLQLKERRSLSKWEREREGERGDEGRRETGRNVIPSVTKDTHTCIFTLMVSSLIGFASFSSFSQKNNCYLRYILSKRVINKYNSPLPLFYFYPLIMIKSQSSNSVEVSLNS